MIVISRGRTRLLQNGRLHHIPFASHEQAGNADESRKVNVEQPQMMSDKPWHNMCHSISAYQHEVDRYINMYKMATVK